MKNDQELKRQIQQQWDQYMLALSGNKKVAISLFAEHFGSIPPTTWFEMSWDQGHVLEGKKLLFMLYFLDSLGFRIDRVNNFPRSIRMVGKSVALKILSIKEAMSLVGYRSLDHFSNILIASTFHVGAANLEVFDTVADLYSPELIEAEKNLRAKFSALTQKCSSIAENAPQVNSDSAAEGESQEADTPCSQESEQTSLQKESDEEMIPKLQQIRNSLALLQEQQHSQATKLQQLAELVDELAKQLAVTQVKPEVVPMGFPPQLLGASLIGLLSPVIRYLLDIEGKEGVEARRQLRELLAGDGVFKLANLLNRACGELARDQIKAN